MPSVIGSRGQIVIGKPIRDALGLKPGYIAVQHLVDDHVEIFFYPPEHEKSLRGVLARHAKKAVSTDDWPQMREAAWSKEVRRDWESGEEEE